MAGSGQFWPAPTSETHNASSLNVAIQAHGHVRQMVELLLSAPSDPVLLPWALTCWIGTGAMATVEYAARQGHALSNFIFTNVSPTLKNSLRSHSKAPPAGKQRLQ